MKNFETVYDERNEKSIVAQIEYYRALLLLAGFEWTHEHRLQNGYTPGSTGVYAQPWLMVQTQWGMLTVGWRKRVINIDWKSSKYPDIKIEPPDDWITHDVGYIHCYGYQQAISALDKLKLQFKRHEYYDSLVEPKKSEEIARLKASEADEKKRMIDHKLEQARELVAAAEWGVDPWPEMHRVATLKVRLQDASSEADTETRLLTMDALVRELIHGGGSVPKAPTNLPEA